MTYIHVYSGQFVDYVNPDPDTICIEDIAHALALVNRYAGHTPFPYSVAQHSVLASQMAPAGLELPLLMHDAHEAYVGDMPTPLKRLMPEYQEIEDRMEAVVQEKFGVLAMAHSGVKKVDTRMLATEARIFNFNLWVSIADVKPYDEGLIQPWSWSRAKREFLERFEYLTGTREV